MKMCVFFFFFFFLGGPLCTAGPLLVAMPVPPDFGNCALPAPLSSPASALAAAAAAAAVAAAPCRTTLCRARNFSWVSLSALSRASLVHFHRWRGRHGVGGRLSGAIRDCLQNGLTQNGLSQNGYGRPLRNGMTVAEPP
uniref:Secreted protein n=1 Tax=Prorocentrum micans TaxID=2945 RepID=A0A7S2TB30_PROMC